VIPFANVLAELVPSKTVRMRRDFRQLLTSVQAVALLRQCQRRPHRAGEIICLAGRLRRGSRPPDIGVRSPCCRRRDTAIRETVQAVKEGEEVNQAELAERLNWRRQRFRTEWAAHLKKDGSKTAKQAKTTPQGLHGERRCPRRHRPPGARARAAGVRTFEWIRGDRDPPPSTAHARIRRWGDGRGPVGRGLSIGNGC